MPRPYPFPLLLAVVAIAAPAAAVQTREPTLAERYVRVRAAGMLGDLDTVTAGLSVLLARDPGNELVTQRAFREAIAAGDKPLAIRAARVLDQQGILPPDGRLLLAVDAVQARDWKRARAEVDKVEAAKLFAFLAASLRAWIALGAGDVDPLATLEPARAAGLASAYFPPQHALLLLATGRLDEGVAEVRALQAPGSRVRLAAAAALQRAHRDAEAATLLVDADPVLTEQRARLLAGERIAMPDQGVGAGIADLLTQVALDFNRQRLAPVAMMLARLATFADPDNSSAWIATANLLGIGRRSDAALAALGRVRPDDPYAGAAETLKVGILVDRGDNDAALAEATAAASRPGAGAQEYARVGDVQMAMNRPALAAAAFDRALSAAGERAPAGTLWPLWLQRGAALEQADDWPHAKAALDRAYALAPDQPVVLNHLGYSLLTRREDVPRATRLIEAANRLRPDDPAITDSLGWAHFVGGDAATAVGLLERASAGDPGEPTINEHLGDVYWALGRHIEARFAWRAALVTAEAADVARIRAKIDTVPTPATAAP